MLTIIYDSYTKYICFISKCFHIFPIESVLPVTFSVVCCHQCTGSFGPKKNNQITEGCRPKSIAILAICITYICICKCIYKNMYINNHIKSNIIDIHVQHIKITTYTTRTYIYIYTYSILIVFWLCQGLKTRAAYCYS